MAEIILKATQILRNDSSANWSNYATKILEKGEPGVEFTSGAPRLKVGDGKTQWGSLPYAAPSADIYTDNGITYSSGVAQIKHANGSNYLTIDGTSLKAKALITIDRPTSLNDLTRNGLYVMSNTSITDGSEADSYGAVFQLSNQIDPVPGTDGHWIWQLGLGTAKDLMYRRRVNTSDWTDWKKIAFTTSDIEGNSATATTLKTSRLINGLLFNGAGNITNYTTSSTAADVANKTAILANFQLTTGSIVYLRFISTNTASNPTLNVNSTGSKPIQYRGAAVEAGTLAAGRTYCLVYDGTAYQIVGDLDTGLTDITLADVGAGTSDNDYIFNGVTAFTQIKPQISLARTTNKDIGKYIQILEVEIKSPWNRYQTNFIIIDSEGVYSGLFHWKVGTGTTATISSVNYIHTLSQSSTLLTNLLYSNVEYTDNSTIFRLYLKISQSSKSFKVQLLNNTTELSSVKINSPLYGYIDNIVDELPGETSVTNSDSMAGLDIKGNVISSYIKDITSSGKIVTFTKGDGTTGTFTTQDTTYSTGTSSTVGLTKLYTSSGTATDGSITQKGITDLLSNYILSSQKGLANGVAELDENGKVSSGQLPSYVDDVLEYDNKSSFPATGETGKIYVDKTTNLTWRWGGSAYVEISPSLALGTTSSTAFRGDYGNTAYTHATAKGSAFSSGLYKITTNTQGHVTAAIAVTKADITDLGIPAQDTTYGAAGSSLGLVKTGGDVTISSGTITVNDNSHNHTISNVTGLEEELSNVQTDVNKKSDCIAYFNNYNNTANEVIIKLFTIQFPNTYANFGCEFDIYGRATDKLKLEARTGRSTSSAIDFNSYIVYGTVQTSAINNLHVYTYDDESSPRVEFWYKINAWDRMSFYWKTKYTNNCTITENFSVESELPTDFSVERTLIYHPSIYAHSLIAGPSPSSSANEVSESGVYLNLLGTAQSGKSQNILSSRYLAGEGPIHVKSNSSGSIYIYADNATSSAAGLMSANDKEKLDSLSNPVIETALTNQDLDNIKNTGRYYGAGSNTVTNKPDDVDAFGLEVYKMASGYIVQEMTAGTPSSKVGEKYRRYYTAAWSSWIPLPILSAAPTSGQVIIADGTTGKLKSSGFTIAKSVPSNAVFTDTVYTLPTATSSVLGGVKIGSNITNTSGTISLTKANVVAALGYTPPTANTTYSAGSGLSLSGTTFSVKTGGTTSGKNYAVDTDDDGNLIVNVPWTDNNTTYTAGTGLTLSGTQFVHTSYGTAGTYGPSANATLTFGGTFTVPYVTTNAQGHVTASGARTFTMPANPNTDTKVTQSAAITTNGNYPIILGYSTATTAVTNTVNKASALTYNPSTKMLSIDALDITPTSIANSSNTIFSFDGTKTIFSANQFYPSANQNLGAATDTGRWSNLYMKSTISFSAAAYLNSAGSTVNIGVGMSSEKTTYELSMSTTNADFRVNLYSSTGANLGQSANPWTNLYLGSSLSFSKTSGTISVTKGVLYFKVADTVLMQMAGNAVSFNGSSSFYPQQSTATLGDSSHQWKNVYVTEGLKYGSYNLVGFSDGTIKLGDSAFSLVNIASANGIVAVGAGSTGPSLYPSGTMDLGLESNPWANLYIGKKIEKTGNASYYYYEGVISMPPAYPYSQDSNLTIKVPLKEGSYTGGCYFNVYLDRNVAGTKYDPTIYKMGPVNFSATGYNVTLGSTTKKWGAIYSTSSTIQTSDRSEKTDIHYLNEQLNTNQGISLLSLANDTQSIKTSFTTEDILSFVKKINPCTFVYKDNSKEGKYSDIESAIESNNTEYVQLGLIADDLKDEALFNFIGATMKYEEEVEPEQKDEEGNTIKEAVYETKTTLGLKAVPLAVSALTACKSLLETVDQLKQQISDLEYQVGYLKSVI